MIKREFKLNSKNILIYSLLISSLLVMIFLMFPFLQETGMDDLVRALPSELLKAFNMDLVTLSSSLSYIQSEGIIILMIAYGVFSSNLGVKCVLREESEKTVDYLYSKPISKKRVLMIRMVVGTISIIVLNLIISLVMGVGLYINGDNVTDGIILNSVTLLSSLTFYYIMILVSTYLKKTKQGVGISLGLVLGSYVLLLISGLGEAGEFLKYFSIFSLLDIRNIIGNLDFNYMLLIYFLIINIVVVFCTYYRYGKKEFC